MYVPPDEPVHAMGEVNMNFQVEQNPPPPPSAPPTHARQRQEHEENELNLHNMNPIYQRYAYNIRWCNIN